MLIWAFLLLNKKFNLQTARQVYWIAENTAYTNRHERKRNDKEITWQFFSTTTWPCSLPLSVREFEDFLSQSPSLTFYIYYTIKIFLRQTSAIFIKNRLFCNKYWSLWRCKNSDFFAVFHFQIRLFQHTKIPFESAVSIWSGTWTTKKWSGWQHRFTHSIVIMAFALIDFDLSIDHAVNKSVRIVNASAPIAWQVFLQWLWLANPFKWTSANVLQQGIYPFHRFPVLSLPWQVFFKRLFRECDVSPHRQAAPTRP